MLILYVSERYDFILSELLFLKKSLYLVKYLLQNSGDWICSLMWELWIFIFNFYVAFSVLLSYGASKDSKLLRRQLKLREIDLSRDKQLRCGRARTSAFPYTTFYLCVQMTQVFTIAPIHGKGSRKMRKVCTLSWICLYLPSSTSGLSLAKM